MRIEAVLRRDGELVAADGQSSTARRIATCRAMIREVRVIERVFGKRLAGNPELTMLLDLYLAQHEGTRNLPVGGLQCDDDPDVDRAQEIGAAR